MKNPSEPSPSDHPQEAFPLWTRLATAWRRGHTSAHAAAEAPDNEAPLGFSTRVVATWQELRRSELMQRWERLSIRTAIGSCACAAVVGLWVMVADHEDMSEELIILPPLEMEMATGLE